jgi:phosphatidylglycerol:prolipoprotein diacylglycerol transferase
MFPVVVEILGFPIHTYGLLLALGFAVGLWVAITLGRLAGISSEDIGDISLVALVAGLVGGRLLYVAVEWRQFAGDLASIVFRRDGFVFYGGLILAIPITILFVKRKGLDVPRVADVMAPAVAIGHSIGRLGCFAQGCCHGGIFEYGVIFPPESPAGMLFGGAPVHPTQVYESLALLVVFGVLLQVRKRRLTDGAVMASYIGLYGVTRFLIEFLRADDRGFYLGPLSVSQLIALAMIVTAAGIGYRLKKRRETKG